MAKQATFRFYEELNDFLPSGKKKVAFTHFFEGSPSIKDVIESIGVPHVEVDLILVNSNSVDFRYLLQNDDVVSVYPVFEMLDISPVAHLREKPLRIIRFILDVHLGKLAKYLRVLGFDTLYRNDYDDPEIVRISLKESRIILTRDIGILKVKAVTHGYFIRHQYPKQQVVEVVRHFDLFRSIHPFSRCSACNSEVKKVEKETIQHQLEQLTSKYFNQFHQCTGCGKIYWEGSHFDRLREFIEELKMEDMDLKKLW